MSDDAVMKAMHMGGLPWDQRTVDEGEAAYKALQERAGRAEHLLRAIAFDDQGKLQAWLQPLYIREPYVTVLVDKATQLLSPTQETDEPDCTRCGNERTVGGYGTDERFPCPVCRPTQETDPE